MPLTKSIIYTSVAFFFSQDATFSFFCVLGIVRTTNSIKLQLKLFINKHFNGK